MRKKEQKMPEVQRWEGTSETLRTPKVVTRRGVVPEEPRVFCVYAADGGEALEKLREFGVTVVFPVVLDLSNKGTVEDYRKAPGA
jgi:hypothetical protein